MFGISMGTAIVAGILVLAVGAVVRKLWRNRKNGVSCGCGGDCASCRNCSGR